MNDTKTTAQLKAEVDAAKAAFDKAGLVGYRADLEYAYNVRFGRWLDAVRAGEQADRDAEWMLEDQTAP